MNKTVKYLCKLNNIPKSEWSSIEEKLAALSTGEAAAFVIEAEKMFPRMGKYDSPTLYLNIQLGI